MQNSKKPLIFLLASGMSIFFLLSPVLNVFDGFKTDLNDNFHSIKLASTPLKIWNYTWGGSGIDRGYGMTLDSSGNVYVTGYTNSYGAGNYDICLVKFNSEGVKQWNYTWGGSGIDRGYGMVLDSTGNMYVAGYTNSYGAGDYDMCLVKFNSEGIKQWNYTWGGSGWDIGGELVLDSSGNVFVAGSTGSFGAGGTDMCLVKFNHEGIKQWNYTWGGSKSDYGYGVTLDSTGNVYLTGYTYSYGASDYDMCLVKFNPEGIKQWNYTWGGSEIDRGYGVALDSSGNAYIGGETKSFGAGIWNICLVKFDPEGIKQWNYTWGGSGDEGGGRWVVLDSSGNVYVAGSTDSFGAGGADICLVKFNPDGINQWNYTWGGSGNERGNGITLDSSGNVYVTGYTNSYGAGDYDICLVKFRLEISGVGSQILILIPILIGVSSAAALAAVVIYIYLRRRRAGESAGK